MLHLNTPHRPGQGSTCRTLPAYCASLGAPRRSVCCLLFLYSRVRERVIIAPARDKGGGTKRLCCQLSDHNNSSSCVCVCVLKKLNENQLHLFFYKEKGINFLFTGQARPAG